MEIPFFLVYVASWATVCSGIWALFERTEKSLSEGGRIRSATFLKRISESKIERSRWPQIFSESFDNVFGKKGLSFKRFLRSSLGSAFSVLIALTIYIVVRPEELSTVLYHKYYLENVLALVFGTIMLNLVPDYISLSQTRYLIEVSKTLNGIFYTTIILILDFFLTFFVASGILLLYFFLGDNLDNYPNILFGAIHLKESEYDEFGMLNEYSIGSIPFGIWFYSTFFTSVWLWIFLFTSAVIRVFAPIYNKLVGNAMFLDIKNSPMHSIGVVAIYIITLLYLSSLPFIFFS